MTETEAAPDVALDRGLLQAILERAHDLAEIKVVLQVVRLAARGFPGVAQEYLFAPESAHAIAGDASPEPAEIRVLRAVERAVADGLLLQVTVRDQGADRTFVLASTALNREHVMRLRRGESAIDAVLGLPAGDEVVVHRPNVFSLYEQHIGPLTPLTAEHLREAERAYPRDWLEEAILQAEAYGARSWRYIETILQRWETEGGPRVNVR